jgi:ribonuclease D
MPVFRGRAQRRLTSYWWSAIDAAVRLSPRELPVGSPPSDGPPPVSRWADRDPEAAARLAAARGAVAAIGEDRTVPVENLLLPDLLRRICWTPPEDGDVAAALRRGGAREWQVDLLADALAEALTARP